MKNENEKPKIKFYSLTKILKKHAHYNIIFGERSNGKTYAVLKYGIQQYVKDGSQLAIIRRHREDFRGKNAQVMFDSLIANGEVEHITNGEYKKIVYYNSRWYFANYDEDLDKDIRAEKPFAIAFPLTEMERTKSTSYPYIRTILFDEFLTRGYYLPDEFIIFTNLLSTIIRLRDDVKIFMLGNTVNKYCPYFKEMGLNHVPKMEQGTIDVYTYGNSNLKVAVEYSGSVAKNKPSDLYFAFDNPKLDMIKKGVWEIAIYPHLPYNYKYKPMDILYTYFIVFDDNILQCEIISKNDSIFTFIHRKTTPLQDNDYDIIYTMEFNPKPNYGRCILKPANKYQQKIANFFKNSKVFYQDNEIGEIVRNYLKTSSQEAFN